MYIHSQSACAGQLKLQFHRLMKAKGPIFFIFLEGKMSTQAPGKDRRNLGQTQELWEPLPIKWTHRSVPIYLEWSTFWKESQNEELRIISIALAYVPRGLHGCPRINLAGQLSSSTISFLSFFFWKGTMITKSQKQTMKQSGPSNSSWQAKHSFISLFSPNPTYMAVRKIGGMVGTGKDGQAKDFH